ncbi:MAG: 3-methyl-2-oxobutanoate hydroxymethyltransferase [Deltaproteobacteria bacterium]|nr:MAG: 3-methyl-2-oxobutanoate hydroxymethyltransferase [Deltaproteobacteria bacterium]
MRGHGALSCAGPSRATRKLRGPPGSVPEGRFLLRQTGGTIVRKTNILDLGKMKAEGSKIVMITAYDALFSRIFDECGVDVILVGDSLGMVVLGHPDTLNVTMDDMVRHTEAAARGRRRAFLMADMPFLSYQASTADAVRNAGRLLQAGAEAVKLEGGRNAASMIRAIASADIPVMAHIGLTPQSIHRMGGYRVQGKTDPQRERLLDDAAAAQEAGAFSLLLEGIPASLAAEITQALSIPTVGIGAGPGCDGQVLVMQDLLGLFDEFRPKFVKRFGELRKPVEDAVSAYAAAVRDGSFPGREHSF